MAGADIVCNFKRCRKRLISMIWVTSCSHAFCEDDGAREFSRDPENNTCPACSTPLTEKYDIVKTNLNPTEQFKSMVLAGLRPETILDIATRAISFWSYQIHQERLFQETSASKIRDRQHQLEEFYESSITQLKAEVAGLRRQLDNAKKELENQTQRAEEAAEQLREKIQQYQKLQVTCSALRRAALTSSLSEVGKGTKSQTNPREFSLGPKTLMEEIPLSNQPKHQSPHGDGQGFNFQPVTPGAASLSAVRINELWGGKK